MFTKQAEQQIMIKSVTKLVDICSQFDVKIVVNQKVVGHEIKQLFSNRNILILERVGYDGINRLRSVLTVRCGHNKSDEPLILESLSDFGNIPGKVSILH